MQISVIIPAYNEEKYLSRAIESALHQSIRPTEILVINDGSTDNTSDVAESYGGIVKHIFQDNKGLASTRNLGIKKAECEYIAFLDADDEWNVDFIANAIDSLTKSGANWYTCAYERRSESGETLFIKRIPSDCYHNFLIKDYFEVEAHHHFSITNTMIVKATIFDKVGMFDETIGKFGEDLDMWFRIALHYPVIAYSDYIGSIYWMREGSITTRSKVDLELFVERIHKSESVAYRLGVQAIKKSEVLVMDWVWIAIKECVKQNDVTMLKHMLKHYYQRLEYSKRFKVMIYRIIPNSITGYLVRLLQRA